MTAWLLALPARATPLPPDTASFRIHSLPEEGLLLTQGWCYHAGDHRAGARPNFDDSGWQVLNPSRPRRALLAALGTALS